MMTRDHLSERNRLSGMSSTIPDNQDRQSIPLSRRNGKKWRAGRGGEHKTNHSDYQQRQKPVFTLILYRQVLRNITATLKQAVDIVSAMLSYSTTNIDHATCSLNPM